EGHFRANSGRTSCTMALGFMPPVLLVHSALFSKVEPRPEPNRRRNQSDRAAANDEADSPPPRRSVGDRPAPTTLRNTVARSARTIRRVGCKTACGWFGRQNVQARPRSPTLTD